MAAEKKCCVQTCGLDTEILHKFPNPEKDIDRFRTWVYKIGGDILSLDNSYIFKYRRVCHLHFESSYHTRSKMLSVNAIPTLHLPAFSRRLPLTNVTNYTVPDKTESNPDAIPSTSGAVENKKRSISQVEAPQILPQVYPKAKKTVNKCQCCLSESDLMSIWEGNECFGEKEIYGDMLKECYGFEWPCDTTELICGLCVSRLREAFEFKKVILASQEILKEGSSTLQYSIKVEDITEYDSQVDRYEEVEYLECEIPEIPTIEKQELHVPVIKKNATSDTTKIEEELLPTPMKIKLKKENVTSDTATINVEESSRPMKRKRREEHVTSDTASNKEEELPTGKIRKWPKKKIRSERNKTYKQYTQNGLNEAIKLVRSNFLTVKQAAVAYGIPKNTLSFKVNHGAGKEVDEIKGANVEKHQKLVDELRILLTYTNAIPFRTKTTRYYCFYCSTFGPYFEDPDELREHTRTTHTEKCVDKLEHYMTPQWMNEVVKLDVDGLECVSCCINMPDWNKVFEHFAISHDVEFDEAYRKIIPYALSPDLQCILCNEAFSNYGHLDSHMNSHYTNYICYECGDTFLSATRLDKHLKVHKVGSYPCQKCDKVFTLEKYRAKHFTLVHKQDSNVKCLYCPAKFLGTFQRHKHVTEMHKDKVKTLTCEVCGKSFTWKPYFFAHMRRQHDAEKKFKCSYCDKMFNRNYELKNHELRHTNDKKFVCGLCGEIYTKMVMFRRHMQTHVDVDQDTGESG